MRRTFFPLFSVVVTIIASAGLTTASYDNNLSFRSPSRRHAKLGVPQEHLAKRSSSQNQQEFYSPAELSFTHGIASGDPWHDSVILWTRLAPHQNNTLSEIVSDGFVPIYDEDGKDLIASSSSSSSSSSSTSTSTFSSSRRQNEGRKAACVEFRIARDEGMKQMVDEGRAYTTGEVDFTVKFEAKNLEPLTVYHYQFHACSPPLSNSFSSTSSSSSSPASSPIGRLKTLPFPTSTAPLSPLRLAVFSCAKWESGYFNAYGSPVRKDSVDWILHLGDYIYEEGPNLIGDIRTPEPPRECFTLYDYRRRIASYRTDPDLLSAHARFAWITTWDDHEVGDNSWRSGSSDSMGEVFRKRKMAAVRAYWEWMPLRQVDADDNLRIWRKFGFGDLMDLSVIDTRHYDRDVTTMGAEDVGSLWGGNNIEVDEIVDWENRTMMGFRQEKWLYDGLRESQQKDDSAEKIKGKGGRWKVVGNQVVFSRMTFGIFGETDTFNHDSWDGYLANRDRFYTRLGQDNIENLVMLSGDSHAAWVSDLVWWDKRNHNMSAYDPRTGEVRGGQGRKYGVEFAGSAISSESPAGADYTPKWLKDLASDRMISTNPELQWQDLEYRGYFEMEVSYEKLTTTYFGMPDITTRNERELELASFEVLAGENKLRRNPTVGGGKARSGSLRGGVIVGDFEPV